MDNRTPSTPPGESSSPRGEAGEGSSAGRRSVLTPFDLIDRVARGVAGGLGALAAVLIAVLMVLTLADVGRRQFFGSSVPGAIEYVEIALVALAFGGLALAEYTNSHVRTPILTDRLRPTLRALARLTSYAVSIAFVSWVAYVTGIRAIESIESGEYRIGISQVSVWPARVSIPIGLAALALVMLRGVVAQVDELVASRRGAGAEAGGAES